MTPHDYLCGVLISQEPTEAQLQVIRGLRSQVEGHLRPQLGLAPRIYYGGSYGKGTMIREAFDLDLVVYYPHTETASVARIFNTAHYALIHAGYIVQPKTVALRLPYQPEFHVDVVPGRAQDPSFRYATLFKNTLPPSTLQTSLKVHIDAVKKTGLAPIIRLLKVWRRRHNVPLSTFMLEIIATRALHGHHRDDYGHALMAIFEFIAQEMVSVRLDDPANTNNEVEVATGDRGMAAIHAAASRGAQNWGQIIW